MKDLYIENVKIEKGQKLFSIQHGEVTVSSIKNTDFPIICENINGNQISYSLDGKYRKFDAYPSLYLSNPFEKIDEFPKSMEVKIGDFWKKRIVLFKNQKGYFVVNGTENLESLNNSVLLNLFTPEQVREIIDSKIIEYTIQEIADKLGVDVKTIRIKK